MFSFQLILHYVTIYDETETSNEMNNGVKGTGSLARDLRGGVANPCGNRQSLPFYSGMDERY